MTIDVSVRRPFGRVVIDPLNDAAKTLAQIAGTPTLTSTTLSLAVRLGLKVRVLSNDPRTAGEHVDMLKEAVKQWEAARRSFKRPRPKAPEAVQ